MMSGSANTYPCPWCEAQRPRTTVPCPECGHVDKSSVLPRHVWGLPGGDAIAQAPMAIKLLLVVLIMWLLMTLAFILKYG
jgi:hypothetical protein